MRTSSALTRSDCGSPSRWFLVEFEEEGPAEEGPDRVLMVRMRCLGTEEARSKSPLTEEHEEEDRDDRGY